MKYYNWHGQIFKNNPPDPLYTEDGRSISPVDDATFEAEGGVITEDEKPTPEQEAHAAWKQFRKAVYDTQKFLHDPTYMGGFDEDYKIENSEYTAADPTTALMLTTRLQNANSKCVYRSGLIGLGQPDWYFECWKHTDEDDPED
jgi:hypothetical protein